MTDSSSTQPRTFRQLVASQFANRPSLRKVAAKAGFALLLDRYPWTSRNHPQLQSLEPFTVIHAAGVLPAQQPLVQQLLEHFLRTRAMALTASDSLSVAPPMPFYPQAQPRITLNMTDLSNDFDELLSTLVEDFQQAQVSFWAGSDDASGISRLDRLAQTAKAALLCSIQQPGLAEGDRATLYSVLDGTGGNARVNALQVTLAGVGPLPLPDLLIITASGRVIWCKPSGFVRSYSDQAGFAKDLNVALAQQYQFDTLQWALQPLQADPFRHQAQALLNGILDRLNRLQVTRIATVAELEIVFSTLSDPSTSFIDQPLLSATLPAWLASASASNRFHYGAALLWLGASQAQAKGVGALDDIQTLDRYAASRLQQQMQLDHPGLAPCDPDQVLVKVSQVVEISSVGPAELADLKTVSLTELSITRLNTESNEVASGLSCADQKPLPGWLSLDYVSSLIDTVDVGGTYPGYVAQRLKDENDKALRMQRYAKEWRSTLLFAALQARCEDQLSERACQAVADFCQGGTDTGLSMAPLAFLPAPGASASHTVHGAYLLNIPPLQVWFLYCPYAPGQQLFEFFSLDALMNKVRADHTLQQHLLDLLDDEARAIYDNGGFTRPHLHPRLTELAHLFSTDAGLIDAVLERLKVPVNAVYKPWQDDLDSQMFAAHIATMLLFASRQSVSNAQLRQAMAKRLAWMLFNSAMPMLRGPAAVLGWLVTVVTAFKDDLPALANGSFEEKALAAADLLGNLAMLLTHPASATPTAAVKLPATSRIALNGMELHPSPATLLAEKPKTTDWVPVPQARRPASLSVTRWHSSQRLGNLPADALRQLNTLQATVSLKGQSAVQQGRFRGLYSIGQRYYAKLQDIPFEVEETWGGMQIIGPESSTGEWQTRWGGADDGYHIVGRTRSRGPWLNRWNGEWGPDLQLAGGMPRNRADLKTENQQQFDTWKTEVAQNSTALDKLQTLMSINQTKLKAYDDKAAAFSDAYTALPDPDLKALPEPLREQHRQLLQLRGENRLDLNAAMLFLEKQSALLHANRNIFRQMIEPRFLKLDQPGAYQHRFSNWTETAIDNDMMLLRRLLELIDHDHLKTLAVGLSRLPENPQQLQHYSAFRTATEDALALTRRLFTVNERLDRLLTEALDDSRIDFSHKRAKINEKIKLRPNSTLIVRAQILSDLAYLTLDKASLTAEAATDLLPLQSALTSKAFVTALWSHDRLASAELPAEQQAEVLSNALREYRGALGKAHYMQTFAGPGLNAAMLEAFVNELTALVHGTELQLSNTLANIDKGVMPAPQRLTYRVRPSKPTLIRTTKGRTVLVEHDRESNRAVQHNPLTRQPASNYEQRGDEWVELPGQDRPASHDMTELRRRATRLLEQKDERIRAASRYTDKPNSLTDLMDWHIDDMREVAQQLAKVDTPEAANLAAELSTTASVVETEKGRLLTDAYLNTHHPDAKALRYLYQAKRLQIDPTTTRKRLRNANDYLDVYQIRDVQAPAKVLWEAHFHYRSANAAPHAFVKGHLKFWEPSGMARDVRLEATTTAAERLDIYRGDLRLEQVSDIIPFPAG